MTERYERARPLLERSLTVTERHFGADHLETAICLNKFASVLRKMGDLPAARPFYERALKICEKAVSPEHPLASAILNNLACLLEDEGDLAISYFPAQN
jgi:tetratricopeptide (TPR) repeat protein